ncbi:xyloglucan endotransglucosylase/hydrolase protein 22 [Phtheirospermum japonicum]|uniref:Xyloglucan endotransglucosylase/hydrolase n=1 Tax=Phtheirospermum japonicum TaxID=374723 RepID=A0A830BM36_9LAMI|nr:xyloglucan endotransglucosylase/hydrolase protein 22 [Phtheirospermum japonicum]
MESFVLKVLIVMAFLLASTSAGNFSQDVNITWGGPRGRIENGGQVLSLSLDNNSGSGFESKNSYLYSRFDMQLKLVPGDSAGTVTTFYLSSQGTSHDEIDFEFLGNSSGQPYTVHTNVFTQGSSNREQQFRLWFDPTASFHSYTILWNSHRIIYMIDNIPIRVFNNSAAFGVPFPTSQPMKMYASLWNALHLHHSLELTTTYKNLTINGCVVNGTSNSCKGAVNRQAWQTQGLDAKGRKQIQWVQQNHMIYNYCDDVKRFPQGLPKECSLPRL